MRILYVASGIPVPGNYGGSTHTVEVGRGLAELGHQVTVVAWTNRNDFPRFIRLGEVDVYRFSVPKVLSLGESAVVARLARRLAPDVIMERYYNFAGAGMIVARRLGLPSVLEINAPVFDPDDTPKSRLDRTLLGGALRRWGETQCQWADRIVTPLPGTVPPAVPRGKIYEINWGANVDLFRPELAPEQAAAVQQLRSRLGLPEGSTVVVFQGSFRPWHGVAEFVAAAKIVAQRAPRVYFLMVGTGPLHRQVSEEVSRSGLNQRLKLVGSVSYAEMPVYLSLARVAVAPFNTAVHAPLREVGFYWSPLKIFEYMAMGLPVVTADIQPLNAIIRPGQEGLLFREGDAVDLAERILTLLANPADAKRMGASGRERVVESYSWRVHCGQLDEVIRSVAPR